MAVDDHADDDGDDQGGAQGGVGGVDGTYVAPPAELTRPGVSEQS
ncbi:MAG TPA: hypothetical protein VH089_29705 [Streptosporangiaceae bacterium]|nr:hypothetical protein [Streptosporangiaceae bacterium]